MDTSTAIEKMVSLSYGDMSKTLYNSPLISQGAVNAGVSANLIPNTTITQATIDSYGMFNRLYIENRTGTSGGTAAVIILVSIQGHADGANLAGNPLRTIYLEPASWVLIEPSDNIIFDRVAIKNLSGATNTVSGDIVYTISNY